MSTTLPYSALDLSSAPDPMFALTNVVISPQNIALEARLSRMRPLSWLQVIKLKWELKRLERGLEAMGDQGGNIEHYVALRESLKLLLDHKMDLATRRQLAPDDVHLAAEWDELYSQGRPLQAEYDALRAHLKTWHALNKSVADMRQRIEDNPTVRERARQNEATMRLQQEEARAYQHLIIDRWTALGFSYRWTDNKGNKKNDEVKFSEVHITDDAVYYKIGISRRTSFGGWQSTMPLGVKTYDLTKEETLIELSHTCQRQVTAKVSSTGGVWIVVHRLDTNDGLLNQVRFADVMERYPQKVHALLPLGVGVTYHKNIMWLNLAQYPHMLIAGFTGSGKSNLINCIISTLISRHSPDEVRLVLVDLKDGIEFSSFESVPHLHGKVVDTTSALADRLQELEAVMRERNHLMRGKARNLFEYKAKFPSESLPRIICIIDEVASIIAQGETTKRIENSLRQLTAKGRAPGIHIILSTQRPSVDAIPGSIKVNLAARIVGRMPSHTDSLTVLGTGEAKELASVPGRMILQIGPDPIPMQTPMIDELDIAAALKAALTYDTPAPLAVPDDLMVSDEWTPERIIELSLNFFGGNLSHNRMWEEIKSDGNITQSQLRDLVRKIWAMDCIPFDGKEYRVERGKAQSRKLVEITHEVNQLNSEKVDSVQVTDQPIF